MKVFEELISRLKKLIENFSDDGLGHNYEEYRGEGMAAVKHLMETKEGQVKGAFFSYKIREVTGCGEIDIVWGKVLDSEKHTGYGIAHILDKHGIDSVNMIGEIIEKGTVHPASNNKLKIVNGTKEVILRQEWFGKKRNIIVSAFDKARTARK